MVDGSFTAVAVLVVAVFSSVPSLRDGAAVFGISVSVSSCNRTAVAMGGGGWVSIILIFISQGCHMTIFNKSVG